MAWQNKLRIEEVSEKKIERKLTTKKTEKLKRRIREEAKKKKELGEKEEQDKAFRGAAQWVESI